MFVWWRGQDYGRDCRRKQWAGERRCWPGLECTVHGARVLCVSLSLENEQEVLPAGSEPWPLLRRTSALCCGARRSATIMCYSGSPGLGGFILRLHYFKVKRSTKPCVGVWGKISSISVPTSKVPKTRERMQTSQKRTAKEKLTINCLRKNSYPSAGTPPPVSEQS